MGRGDKKKKEKSLKALLENQDFPGQWKLKEPEQK